MPLLGDDGGVNARRIVLLATAGLVAVLGVLLAVAGWDDANKIAVVVSTLAAVAGVGVAIWAGLPAVSAVSGRGTRVSRTGRAAAGAGGRANSGVYGPASSLSGDVTVDRTGDADASGGGDANTGVQLN